MADKPPAPEPVPNLPKSGGRSAGPNPYIDHVKAAAQDGRAYRIKVPEDQRTNAGARLRSAAKDLAVRITVKLPRAEPDSVYYQVVKE